MAKPTKTRSGLLEEFLQKASGFFEGRGISPPAGIGFSLLVLAGILALLYSSLQAPPQELRALVLSNDERVSDALVEVYSQQGELLASGTAGSDGQISFKKSFYSDKLVIKASKDGFVAADGSRQAIAIVDLSKKTRVALELYSSHVTPRDFNGEIVFTVLDRISGKPIENAALELLVGSNKARLTTDSNGLAFLRASAGESFRVKASAEGYNSDDRGFVAIRGEEKISLLPLALPSASGSTEFAAPVPPLLTSDSVLEDALPQSAQPFLAQAKVVVTNSAGNALQAGVLRVVSASGQEISSSTVSNGVANFDGMLLSQDFHLKVEGTDSGKVELFHSSSPIIPVLSAPIESGRASLSPHQLLAGGQAQLARLLLAAKPFGGVAPVAATFSIQGVGDCSGTTCMLVVPAGQLLSISASAPGYGTATVSKKIASGELDAVSFELVPQGQELGVFFQGARDEQGRQVSSLLAGRSYFLVFSFSSPARSSPVFSVRLGELSHVRDEGFGIADFPPQEGLSSTKSVSYSPQPTCTDLNNNEPVDGLFKWIQLSSEASGPIHKIVSIPIRVKPNSRQNSMKIFYRLETRTGSRVSRVPEYAALDEASREGSPSRAGCYADSLAAEIPIAFSNNCFDGTAPGFCSLNSPLHCGRRSDGSLSMSPGGQCCPINTILSGEACVTTVQPSGDCSDGTREGECSAINSPKRCSGGVLVASPQCCFPGEVFQQGACRSKTASCTIGSRVFADGACLPTKPGRCMNGIEFEDASACGCPEGLQANGNSCGATASAFCEDGTSFGACSPQKPSQCVSIGGRLTLVDHALSCGCGPGLVSSGVACVAAGAPSSTTQAPPIPTRPQLAAPNPAPPRACSNANRCLAPDEFCNSQFVVVNDCSRCNRQCSGNSLFSCNAGSGACEPLKCNFPLPGGTPVKQCVEESRPWRCELVGGAPRIADESRTCGCGPSFEPDQDGVGCVACPQSGCLGGSACRDPEGVLRPVGSCLPEVFGTQGVASAQPILKCLAGGAIAPDIVQCGCPSGFVRSLDNSICVRQSAPASSASLSGAPVCEGCVSEYTVRFNSDAGRLEATEASIELRADPIFPADAVPLKLDAGSSASFRISVQHFKSSTASEPCYAYDVQKAMLSFKVGGPCPIEVHGNKFYHAGLKKEVTSDAVEITVRRETVPPQDLVLEINVKFNPLSSLLVYPSGVQGSGTPQFVFVLNEKQTVFGPRELQVSAQSTQKSEFAGAGAKVFAWRGPGELAVSEKTQQVGFVSYDTVASYYSCFDGTGPRAETGCEGNAFCCAGAWCTKNAFSQMLDSFKEYARATALQTAFRRGNVEPFNTITGGAAPFELHTAAQVIDFAPSIVSSLGLTVSTAAHCSATSNPAVFSIKASTKDGGKTFSYSAETAALHQFDYVEGTCGDPSLFKSDPLLARPDVKAQFLCDFLHGDCSCVKQSKSSSTVTQAQNLPGAAQPTDANPNNLASILPQLANMLKDLQKKMGDQGAGSGQYPPDEAARRQLTDNPTVQRTSFNANSFAEAARSPAQAFRTASEATDRGCGAGVPDWVDRDKQNRVVGASRFALDAAVVRNDLSNSESILKKLADCENEPGGRDTAAKCGPRAEQSTTQTRQRIIGSESISGTIEGALRQCVAGCANDGACAQGCRSAKEDAQRNLEEKIRRCSEEIRREMDAARVCERLNKVEPQTPEPRIGPLSKDWQTLYAFSAHALPGAAPPEGGGGCTPICAGRYTFALRGSRDNTDIVVLRSGVGGERPGECRDVEVRNAGAVSSQTANTLPRFAASSVAFRPQSSMPVPRTMAPRSSIPAQRRMSQEAFPGEVFVSLLEGGLQPVISFQTSAARLPVTIRGCIPCLASNPSSPLGNALASLRQAGYSVPSLERLQELVDAVPPEQRRQANGQPTHLPLDGTAIFASPELRIIQSEATPEGQAAAQGRGFNPGTYMLVEFGGDSRPVSRFENPSPDDLNAAIDAAGQGRLPTPPPTANLPTPLPPVLPAPAGSTPFQEGGSGFMQVPGDGSEIGGLPPVEIPEKDTPQRLLQKAAESREQEGAPFSTAFQSFRRNPFPGIPGMSRFDFTSPLDDRQRADLANTLHDRTASITGNRRAVLVMTPETQSRFGLSPQDAPVGQVRLYEGRGGGQLGPGGSIVGAPLIGAINAGFVNGRLTPQTISTINSFVLGR